MGEAAKGTEKKIKSDVNISMYGVDFSCYILQKNTVKIRFSCHRKKFIVLLFKVHHLLRLITESAVKSIFI